jgi:hypothetical protein
MAWVFGIWVIAAAIIVVFAVVTSALGRSSNILIDGRGRYSLNRFQVVVWTVVVLSLICGVAGGRLLAHRPDVLSFDVPSDVLGLLGISVGSAVLATAVKISKSTTHPERIAANQHGAKASVWEMLLVEEGASANKTIDVTKFQNFAFTVVLVVAYVTLAAAQIKAAGDPANITSLPTFPPTFLALLGISHAGYLGGKIPSPAGTPDGYTVANRAALPDPNGANPGGGLIGVDVESAAAVPPTGAPPHVAP